MTGLYVRVERQGRWVEIEAEYLTAEEWAALPAGRGRFLAAGLAAWIRQHGAMCPGEKLARFAVVVLTTLENEQEWSADTTDGIAETAIGWGLAATDDGGFFRMADKECCKCGAAILEPEVEGDERCERCSDY